MNIEILVDSFLCKCWTLYKLCIIYIISNQYWIVGFYVIAICSKWLIKIILLLNQFKLFYYQKESTNSQMYFRNYSIGIKYFRFTVKYLPTLLEYFSKVKLCDYMLSFTENQIVYILKCKLPSIHSKKEENVFSKFNSF